MFGTDETSEDELYCTPQDVAETMGLPLNYGLSDGNAYEYYMFSDTTIPSYKQVTRMIQSNMDQIDRRLNRAWRVKYVKNKIISIDNYQMDNMGRRITYYESGGYAIPLRRNILEWDPRKGDRMELRNRQNQWHDITLAPDTDPLPTDSTRRASFWFDYNAGRLILRKRLFGPNTNALRISYRYGSEEEPPESIRRLCALMTACQVIEMSIYDIKVGTGGDLSGIKDNLLRNWQMEIGDIMSTWQRSGRVYSLTR